MVVPCESHAGDIVTLGKNILQKLFTTSINNFDKKPLEVRIGIHSGPLVAGVIRMNSSIYDAWGPALDVADSLQSMGKLFFSSMFYWQRVSW